ncbi:FAD-dependent monooxygenase [Streptomyces sp. NPDC048352]|uniref:FAD-dependent monooxygenase n=1 Tax=Streptomyces sp. NPDC048352 TaxID=3154718 RepID=UPI003426D47E
MSPVTEQPRRRPLVVGASAAGLTVAHELARRGLPVRVVDAAAGPAAAGHPVDLRPRTLEVLDQMGIVDGVLLNGRTSGLDADYSALPTRYPYTVVIDRALLGALLREAVAALGVGVEWGVRPPYAPDASWLVTCDGSAEPPGHAGRRFTAGADRDPDTGIRQAYNLAWKLAMVEQGHAGPRLLHSYEEELSADPGPRPGLLALADRVPALRRTALGRRSGLGLAYRDSSLTTRSAVEFISGYHVGVAGPEPTPAPGPGSRVTEAGPACDVLRAELRDPRWSLLLAAGGAGPQGTPETVAAAAGAQYGAWLSVRILGDAASLPDPGRRLRTALGTPPGGWLLIRPDGYLAARGTLLTAEALDRALLPLSLPLPLLGTGAHPCG